MKMEGKIATLLCLKPVGESNENKLFQVVLISDEESF